MAVKNNIKKKQSKPKKEETKIEEALEEESTEEIENNEEELEVEEIKKNNNKIIYIIIIGILLLGIIGYLLLPKIELLGNKEIIINYKDTYIEPGYKAKILFKDISKNIKIDNNIVPNKVGNYIVKYKLNYGIIKINRERIVKIIDNIKPVIDIEDEIKVCPGADIEPKFIATDEYDGDLTDKVIITNNDNLLILTVKDNSNNEIKKEVKITKEDKEKPKIVLLGNNTIYLDTATRYNEPGYKATDNCDGDITDKVTVSGNVGIGAGIYKLTYSVTDNEGNKGEVTRTIIVRNTNLANNGSISSGTIYLTFDDGPRDGTTNVILDILKEENVKATFFVTCNGPDYLISRIYNEGHMLALHTATHEYSYVYSSVDNYFNDLNRVKNRVKNITGYDSKIIRFPGGSSNTISRNYQVGIMSTLTSMVLDKGYRYFDWNVDSNDAGGARNSSDVYYNVVSHLSKNRANVVLMHDIKPMTRDALRNIIKYGKDNGYNFKRIENDTYMVRHGVNN